MRGRAQALTDELDESPPTGIDAATVEETKAFLTWLADDNFTFLGYRDYNLTEDGDEAVLTAVDGSGLGILRGVRSKPPKRLSPQGGGIRPRAQDPSADQGQLGLARPPARLPRLHRGQALRRGGRVVGERRFLGLYTTRAYKAEPAVNPDHPRQGRGRVVAGRVPAGQPRPQGPARNPRVLSRATRCSRWRPRTCSTWRSGSSGWASASACACFTWRDPLDRFVECLVCIPRDRFNTENRERVGRILLDALGGVALDWTLQLSESRLARVHYIIRSPRAPPTTTTWPRSRRGSCRRCGRGPTTCATRCSRNTARRKATSCSGATSGPFHPAIRPTGSRAPPSPISTGSRSSRAPMSRSPASTGRSRRPTGSCASSCSAPAGCSCRTFCPTLEHLGAKVADERPYEITAADRDPVWIYDFGLQADAANIERVRDLLHDAFLGVWRGELEDDGLNGLVLGATLTGRQVSIIRAIAKYLRQAGIGFSDAYMQRTLTGHPDIARLLVELFNARLDPDNAESEPAERIATEIEEALDAVPSLDEDRILRSFLSACAAMHPHQLLPARSDGSPQPYLSFKLDSEQLPLAAAAAAAVRDLRLLAAGRGRASARRAGGARRDALVGPPRGLPDRGPRADEGPDGQERRDRAGRRQGRLRAQAASAEGGREAAARRGDRLLPDVPRRAARPHRQHRRRARSSHPTRVVRYDDDDPYLVVAADKGTATFSDIANGVSADYGFWLGDAFASGGSPGLRPQADGHHRPRARGRSVKRHFRELGIGHPDHRLHGRSASATCPATCSATACCCRATSS